MKKILIVSNEFGFTQNVIRFSIEVAKGDNSMLHSIFMQPLHEEEELSYLFPNDYRLTTNSPTGEEYTQEDQRLIESNIQYFKNECIAAHIPFRADTHIQTTIRELIAHSYFADLIILDADADVGPYPLKGLLVDAHCPVCLIPSRATSVEQVILCYDGSDSSIYALKMYSYLFGSWSSKPTTLLTINGKNTTDKEVYIDDWLEQHFPTVKREVLAGNAQKELANYVYRYNGGAFVVLGAYSRNAISRLLHQSTADTLMQQTGASLFVAHQ